jgi:hypothetical protein
VSGPPDVAALCFSTLVGVDGKPLVGVSRPPPPAQLTLQQAIANHPKARAKHDAIVALTGKLPPHAFGDTVHAPPGPPVHLSDSPENAIVTYAKGDSLDDALRMADGLSFCDATRTTLKPEDMSSNLGLCEALQYVVVLRTFSFSQPRLEGSNMFVHGHVEGDATLFEIDSGKSFGGVHYSVRNPAVESVRPSDGVTPLQQELGTLVYAAVRDAMSKHLPGAKF